MTVPERRSGTPVSRPQPRQRERHPRAERPAVSPSRRRAPRLWTPALLTILFVAVVLCLFVVSQIQITQATVARSSTETRTADEAVRIQSLRTEVAQLESPARIVDEARRMGMVAPAETGFVHVPRRTIP